MRRIALTIATIVALAYASIAMGAVKQYRGAVEDELCGATSQVTCNVSFRATVKHGKVKEVNDFVLRGVPMECDQATIVVDSSPGLAVNGMRVNKQRRFSGSESGTPNAEITVEGRFSKNFKTATGTLVNTLSDPPQVTNCTTDVDNFTASR